MALPLIILGGDDEKIIFEVQSTSEPEDSYIVTWDFDDGWLCTCEGCTKGHYLCKHILQSLEYMKKMNMALLDDPRTVFEGGLIG